MSFSITDMYTGATEPTAGLIFIGPGNHLLTLAEFRTSHKANEAPKYRADFVVVESDYHKPGDIVSKTFKPYDNPFPGAGQKEAGRMMAMVRDLNGLAPDDRLGAAAETEKMLDRNQPARGFRISASGYDKPPKPGAVDKHGKPKGPYTIVTFFPASTPNTPEQVMGDKAKIEALPQMKARAAAGQQATAQPQYQQPASYDPSAGQQPPAPQQGYQQPPQQPAPQGDPRLPTPGWGD